MKLLPAISVLLLLAVGTSVLGDHHEAGFVSLFDGQSLQGWDGNPKFWSVRDGAITGQTTTDNPTRGNTFIIWRGGQVDDFELRLKYRIGGGNSGIQYRSQDHGNWVMGGYQGDFEAGDTFSGILYDERGRGILARRGEFTHVVSTPEGKHKVNVIASLGDTDAINAVIKKEDWNDYQIFAHGGHFMHVINGRVTCQVLDDDKANAESSGLLALQLHAGPPMTVQFKDIRIKPLKGIDIRGEWEFEVTTDAGQGSPSFTFRTEGNELKGDYNGLLGDQQISGKVEGNRVSWTVVGAYDGQEIRCVYQGKVTRFNAMSGTVNFNDQFEAKWTAKKK